MALRPYDRLPDAVEYKGTTYRADLSFAAVLAASDAIEDEDLPVPIRLHTALELLITDPHPDDPGLLRAVFDLIRENQPTHVPGPKTMDLREDWAYVCAAFQQAYGIDLYADKSLHILRFQALLRGLPKSTKLSEIIGIRAAKIPAPNKHNKEQIAELMQLKARYALHGSGDLQEGWGKIFQLLTQRAPHG